MNRLETIIIVSSKELSQGSHLELVKENFSNEILFNQFKSISSVVYFRWYYFFKVYFIGSHVVACNFQNCLFDNVILIKCEFWNFPFETGQTEKCNLTRTAFYNGNLKTCNFIKVNLTVSNFSYFEFIEIKLKKSKLSFIEGLSRLFFT